MKGKLSDEAGFGLIELLFAIILLNIGIFALVGALTSSSVALARAGKISSAQTVADQQMEDYRARPNCAIYLTSSSFSSAQADTRYTGDTAYSSSEFTDASTPPSPLPTTCTSGVPANLTTASQTMSGPDGTRFRVDTYITVAQPTNGQNVKQVVVVIRATSGFPTWTRETAAFDPTTG